MPVCPTINARLKARGNVDRADSCIGVRESLDEGVAVGERGDGGEGIGGEVGGNVVVGDGGDEERGKRGRSIHLRSSCGGSCLLGSLMTVRFQNHSSIRNSGHFPHIDESCKFLHKIYQ